MGQFFPDPEITERGWFGQLEAAAASAPGRWSDVDASHVADYELVASDDEKLFLDMVGRTWTVPDGLPVGFRFGLYQGQGSSNIVTQTGDLTIQAGTFMDVDGPGPVGALIEFVHVGGDHYFATSEVGGGWVG